MRWHVPNVPENEPERCYHCKKARVLGDGRDRERARAGVSCSTERTRTTSPTIRPGAKATRELGVRSPLKELGFTKERVREMSRELGLATWDKPAYACLASRVPYGTPLTREVLGQIEAAESILHETGVQAVPGAPPRRHRSDRASAGGHGRDACCRRQESRSAQAAGSSAIRLRRARPRGLSRGKHERTAHRHGQALRVGSARE